MKKRTSSEVIEAYRQRSKNRFNAPDIAKALVILLILAISIYIASTGGPELPGLLDLRTDTSKSAPNATTAPELISTGTLAENGCNCFPTQEISSQSVVTVIVVVTPTPDSGSSSTETLSPSITDTPMASLTPTSTPILYIVQPNDTLGDIALRYNVTVEAIQVANRMGGSTIIVVGQTLIIPR